MSDFKDLDQLLQKYVDDGLPGCGMIICKKGEVLYENYCGWADKENGVKLTADHVFRQASLTKIAMYTTAMMLYEQGRFLMSDPLYEYFPEFRHSTKIVQHANGCMEEVPVDKPITIKQIFNMTCGLPYEMIIGGLPVSHPTATAMAREMKELRAKGYFTLRDQIKAAARVPLTFEPGSRFLYGFASELTAGLLEVLCDKPAELVIKEMLFEPLEMNSSANFLFGDLESRLVKDYYLKPGKNLGDEDALYVPGPEHARMFVGPLGTVPGFSRVITNCRDYTRLMQMLCNGGKYKGEQIIGRKTIDLIRTNTIPSEILAEDFSNNYLAGYGYGYGMRTLMDKYAGQHNGSLGQFGWTGGSGTWAECDPAEGLSICYMHNLQPNLEEYHHLRMRAVAYGCL
ncbi:MAG: serine hydrolase domain-containing protein [Lachnospiraceae bacterium]|nr:serine hydrolase domain-containing protein [Lachnospiraceae bacterium]